MFRRPNFAFEDLMGQPSTTVLIGLEMENPATSRGMVKVLQTFVPLIPVANAVTGSGQLTMVGCDQNFFERGTTYLSPSHCLPFLFLSLLSCLIPVSSGQGVLDPV
jgi:hypothetical protein